jgi:hypothetical protein
MLKHFVVLLLSVGISAALLAGPAFAAETGDSSPPDAVKPAAAEGGPSLVFEMATHDFGKIEPDQTVKHTFTFRNEGDALLVIANIRASCSCTGTLLSQSEIPPGEEGSIEVTYNSKGQSGGVKKKTITVQSNDPRQPNTQLAITAEVTVPVEVRPQMVYWPVEQGKQSSQTVALLHQPDIPVNITGLEVSSPAFAASFGPREADDGPGYDISITCDGNLPMGRFSHMLTITTDNPAYATLKVWLRGDVWGMIRVVPRTVSLGVIAENAFPEGVVQVYTADDSDFLITGVESSTPLIETEVSRSPEIKRYVIRVRVTAVPPKGAFSEKIIIGTNSKTEGRIEVAVYGYVK